MLTQGRESCAVRDPQDGLTSHQALEQGPSHCTAGGLGLQGSSLRDVGAGMSAVSGSALHCGGYGPGIEPGSDMVGVCTSMQTSHQ